MSLESQISLITVPQEFVRLCNALLRHEHGNDFTARLVEEIDGLPERLASADGEQIVIDLLLDVTPDDALYASLWSELRRAQRKARWRPAQAERH